MSSADSTLPPDLSAARDAADRFLRAVQQGDEAAARGLLIAAPGTSVNFKEMHESTLDYTLGPAQAEGEQAVIDATVRGEGGPGAEMVLPLVLRPLEGVWKVDMDASMQKMLGGIDLQAMVEQATQGLAQTLGQGMEAMAEGLAEGLQAAFGPADTPPADTDPDTQRDAAGPEPDETSEPPSDSSPSPQRHPKEPHHGKRRKGHRHH